MKHLLAFFTAIMFTSFAHADCSSSALWVFPNEKTIKQNPVFVLEGYAQSQKIISGLNKTYPVYLKSGSKKVKLLVSEVCTGQFYVTQAVLRPETELEAGLDYTICIDNLPEGEGLKRYNGKTQLYESISYKVNAGKDTEKPQLASKPKEIRKTLIHFGCGPSIHVVFDNPAKDDSPVIVGTTCVPGLLPTMTAMLMKLNFHSWMPRETSRLGQAIGSDLPSPPKKHRMNNNRLICPLPLKSKKSKRLSS